MRTFELNWLEADLLHDLFLIAAVEGRTAA